MTANPRYFEIVRRLPIPSPHATEAFVDHVAEAENWLKTPPFEGGAAITVYLDPHAGARLARDPSTGHWSAEAIPGPAEAAPVSELPTAAYRARFGHLQYHADLGAGSAEFQDGLLRRARLPEPGIVDAGRLVPLPEALRTLACRPGALLHGTFRGASDTGGRRRFRFAVERLPRIAGAPAGHPFLERIQAWTTACHAEDQTGFAAWLRSVHARTPEALDDASRWARYLEWRDEEACAILHREQDARFEATGIPAAIVRAHAEARATLERALRAMLETLATAASSRQT